MGRYLLARTAKKDLSGNTIRVVEETTQIGCLREGFQKEETAGAKAPRQACVWQVGGTVRWPAWLE